MKTFKFGEYLAIKDGEINEVSQVPTGYKRVPWSEVSPGTYVYIMAPFSGKMYGPYISRPNYMIFNPTTGQTVKHGTKYLIIKTSESDDEPKKPI